ncbi:hypothetical protein LTR17_023827 [Elasticomyces elasticus]|nr:hypothetical protein LTR17_023827 [Elasticomyces elasticus]
MNENTIDQLLITSEEGSTSQTRSLGSATEGAAAEVNDKMDILSQQSAMGQHMPPTTGRLGAFYYYAMAANMPNFLPASPSAPASVLEQDEHKAANPKQMPMLTRRRLAREMAGLLATKMASIAKLLQTTKKIGRSDYSGSTPICRGPMGQSRDKSGIETPACTSVQNTSRRADLRLFGNSSWKLTLQLLLLSSPPGIMARPTERPEHRSSTGSGLDLLSSQLPGYLLVLIGAFTIYQTCICDMTPQERRLTLLLIVAVMAGVWSVLLSTVPHATNALFFCAFSWLTGWLGLVGVYMKMLKHQLLFIMVAAFIGLGIPALLYKKSTGNEAAFWQQTREVIEFGGAFLITCWVLLVFYSQWIVESWPSRGRMERDTV